MNNIRIDANGYQRCWNCGGKSCFTLKRTFTAKLIFGFAALLTNKKLQCQFCGVYNLAGNAEPYQGAADEKRAQKFGTAKA